MCDRCTALTVFGLTRDATLPEIKDAYRVLAKVWHPDRFHSDERLRQQAEEKLKEINSAYQLLNSTPVEEPPHRSSPPPPPPEEPPRSKAERSAPASAGWSPPRPITDTFAYAFRRKRRAARLRIAIVLLVLIAGGAWLIQRYGRELAYEFNIPINTSAAAKRQTATAPESSPKRNIASSAGSNNSSAKPAHSKAATAASLLVYPAEDPGVPYFTVGSTKSDVVKVQGVPSKIANNVFRYGQSVVYFQDGRVQSWQIDPNSPLKARMPE